jgi:hypothetical protein
MRPNGIGDIARCQMGVMFFGHPCVLMAELRRDHAHRDATHSKCRGMGVPEDVECRGRGNLGPLGRRGQTSSRRRCGALNL